SRNPVSSTRSTTKIPGARSDVHVRQAQTPRHHQRQLRPAQPLLRSAVRHEDLEIAAPRERRGHRRRLHRHEHHSPEARARLREKYPSVQLIQRPSNRPFAGISTHDPEGYVFDLSQQAMANRAEVYVEGEWKQDRYISHFVLRALNPASLAKFYREVYELQECEKPADDPN